MPHLFENKKERIRALNVLAGHQLHMMETEGDLTKRTQHSQQGYKLIKEAIESSETNMHSFCSQCFYEIAAGQLKQASDYYQHCEK